MRLFKSIAIGFLFSSSAFAWTPTKDITIVVPFPPGSGNDIVARSLSEVVTRNTKVKIIVENKSGAGGTVGMTYFSSLPNDGHYAALASLNGIAGMDHALPEPPAYDIKDFSYALRLAYSPVVIIANKDDPVNTIKELVDVLTKQEVSVGHSGGGGRLGLESILLATNASKNKGLVRVEHRGPAQTAIDVVGKHVRFGALPLAVAVTFKEADKIKIITHTSKDEIKTLPNVRPFSTFYPGFDLLLDWGITLPKNTSPDILDWYVKEFSKALLDEKIVTMFGNNFLFVSELALQNPKGVSEYMVQQRKKNLPIVQEVIKLNKAEGK